MNGTFTSERPHRWPATSSCPAGRDEPRPGVILCHGFPIGPLDARRSAGTFPQLIDRIAHDLGYAAMTFNFRGTGTSEGDFSLQGWVDDLRRAIDYLIARDARRPRSCCSARTPAARSPSASAPTTPASRPAALLSPRADFDDWAEHPRRFLEHAREIGADQVARVPAVGRRVEPGVPPLPADRRRPPVRAPAAARDARRRRRERADDRRPPARRRPTATAELSLFAGAGHRLRHDPRAIAVLLGWLDRVARRATGRDGPPTAVATSRKTGAMRPPARLLAAVALCGVLTAVPSPGAVDAASGLIVTPVVSGLDHPWDLAFAPDGAMFVTERPGRIVVRLPDGGVRPLTADLGDLWVSGETGLMGIEVDPGFASNRRVYTCQGTVDNSNTVQVVAWTVNTAYTAMSRVNDPLVGGIDGTSGRHGGCQLRIDPSGALWIGTGDAATGTNPQSPTALNGKVLRVDRFTGAGLPGNPFFGEGGNRARMFTWGHRNLQGLAVQPGTGQMWSVEHGPDRDDEINRLFAGGNYGWDPVPGYNESVPMTDFAKFPNAVPAVWSSGPVTFAISGATFLRGSGWGTWRGRAGGIGAEGLPPARPVLRQRRQVRRRGHPARTEPHVRSTARRRDRAGRRAVPHDRQWERPGSSARRRSADRGHRRRSGRSPRTGCRHRSSRCGRPSLAAQLDREHLARLDLTRWFRVVGPRRQHVGWRPVRRRRARRRLGGLATGARGRRVVRLGQPRRHRDGWTCGRVRTAGPARRVRARCRWRGCGRAATPTGSGPTGTHSAVRSPLIPTPWASTRDGSTCSCAGSTTHCGRVAWTVACGRAGSRSAACSPPARPLLRRVGASTCSSAVPTTRCGTRGRLGAGWGPWDLGVGHWASAPDATWRGGFLDVFGRGLDGGLWQVSWIGDAWWGPAKLG